MTKGNWRPGQLIGQNGSNPATIAQSLSFASPEHRNEVPEIRSATSTGHTLRYRRPADVCPGWGDYDRFTRWQSYGRSVTRDMVENTKWSTELQAPMRFVNESGEVVRTVTTQLKPEDLPSQTHAPVSLYDELNQKDDQKPKAPATGSSTRKYNK
ncbi:hypothetical protein MAJ_11216, partial [Metarhizium majus ARSEF 297]